MIGFMSFFQGCFHVLLLIPVLPQKYVMPFQGAHCPSMSILLIRDSSSVSPCRVIFSTLSSPSVFIRAPTVFILQTGLFFTNTATSGITQKVCRTIYAFLQANNNSLHRDGCSVNKE